LEEGLVAKHRGKIIAVCFVLAIVGYYMYQVSEGRAQASAEVAKSANLYSDFCWKIANYITPGGSLPIVGTALVGLVAGLLQIFIPVFLFILLLVILALLR